MKILHTADWHIGTRTDDYLRLEEQRKKFGLNSEGEYND